MNWSRGFSRWAQGQLCWSRDFSRWRGPKFSSLPASRL